MALTIPRLYADLRSAELTAEDRPRTLPTARLIAGPRAAKVDGECLVMQ